MPRRKKKLKRLHKQPKGYDPSKTYAKWIVKQMDKQSWLGSYLYEQEEAEISQGR